MLACALFLAVKRASRAASAALVALRIRCSLLLLNCSLGALALLSSSSRALSRSSLSPFERAALTEESAHCARGAHPTPSAHPAESGRRSPLGAAELSRRRRVGAWVDCVACKFFSRPSPSRSPTSTSHPRSLVDGVGARGGSPSQEWVN